MAIETIQNFYVFGLGLVILIFFIWWKKDGYLSPIMWFLIHMGLYYVFAPWVEIQFSQYKFNPLTLFVAFSTVTFTLIWFLVFSRLRFFGEIGRFAHHLAYKIETHEKIVRRRVIFISFVGVCILFSSIYFLYGSNLRGVFANPVGYRKYMSNGIISLLYSLEVRLLYDVFFMYLAYRAHLKRKLLTFPIVIYLLFLFVLSFGFGSRGILISVMLQLAVLYEFFYRRISFVKIALLSVLLMPLIVLYSEYRMLGLKVEDLNWIEFAKNLGTSTDISWLFRLIVLRLDAMFNLDIYLKALDLGYLKIEPLVSFTNSWQQLVPRNFAPDKPYYFSSEMTRILLPDTFYDNATYDFTGMAEFIHNFSWEGIVFFSLIPATILALLQRAYQNGDRFIVYFLIYLPFVGLPISIVNNGFLNTGNIVTILPITSIYLYFYFIIFSRHRKMVIRP